MGDEKFESVLENFRDAIDISNILNRCIEGKYSSELVESGKLLPRDHLFITYGLLTHHGIYSSEGNVINYKKGRSKGIMEVSLYEFAKDVLTSGLISKKIYKKEHSDRKYSRAESLERARSRIGEAVWNLIKNNCEHFVEWCINGKYDPEGR